MKRLFLTICLIGIVYVLGTLVIDQIMLFANNASLILGITNSAEIRKVVLDEYNAKISDVSKRLNDNTNVTLESSYINADTKSDIIATIHSNDTCGGGGCITSILLKNDAGKYESIHFDYAVKKIAVVSSLTQGMHDLRINDDEKSLMRWNGSEYSIHGF